MLVGGRLRGLQKRVRKTVIAATPALKSNESEGLIRLDAWHSELYGSADEFAGNINPVTSQLREGDQRKHARTDFSKLALSRNQMIGNVGERRERKSEPRLR